jgi:aminoglycoside phosphotransferase (APT) family kinase protein
MVVVYYKHKRGCQTMTDEGGLGPEARAWIEATVGGGVVSVDRWIHARPMWRVEVDGPDGPRAYMARGRRGEESALAAVYDLAHEARVIERLVAVGVPTPTPHGFHPGLPLLLLDWVDGRSDLLAADPATRRAVALHFMDVLADLHGHTPEELAIPGLAVPRTAEEHALASLEIAERQLAAADEVPPEPFITFGRRWLRAHVPPAVERTSLLQGDTGPGNFMFVGDRFTNFVDWELAHFGDPMFDLAAVCVRDMNTPFADLPELFARYAARAGTPVDLDRVRYHRVNKCVQSLVAITTYAHRARRPDEVALWHGWRALYLRAGCQAIVEAEGGTWAPPPVPEEDPTGTGAVAGSGEPPWAELVAEHLRTAVRPRLDDEFLRHQVDGSLRILGVLAEPETGRALAAEEHDDLAALLGHAPATLADGWAELDGRVGAGGCDDAAVLGYLGRRAVRTARRVRPLMGPFADHRFGPLENL